MMPGKLTTVPGLCDSCFYSRVSPYDVANVRFSQMPHTCPRCHTEGVRLITEYCTHKHGWRIVEPLIGKPDPFSRKPRSDTK